MRNNVLFSTSQRLIVSSPIFKFQVSNTYFVSCSSENGGAIHSEINVEHIIEHCHFYKCKAISQTPDVGRGSAFLINNGTTVAKHCCSEGCESSFGGDMMSYCVEDTKYQYIQSFNSKNPRHGMWAQCSSQSAIKYINITNSVNSNGYDQASSINIHIIEKPLAIMFFNLVENEGKASIFEFEYSISKTVDFSYVNCIKNNETDSFIGLVLCNHSEFNGFNCLFIYNQNTKILFQSQSIDNKFHFFNTTFSIENKEEVNIVYDDDCQFQQSFDTSINTLFYCENAIKITLQQNQYGKIFSMHYLNMFLITLCCYHK